MKRHPIIGSAYQPHRLEKRSATEYSSLRPHVDSLLQRAMLNDQRRHPDRLTFGITVAGLAIILIAVINGVF